MAMLEVKNLGISFGGLRAVNEFSVKIEKGQLYGLIGPNGAGKTTIFNMLTGVYKPTDGIITLDGKNITGQKTIDINKAGIARTFQNIRLFKELTVLDNVKVGLHNSHKYSTVAGILRLPSYFKVEKEMNKKAMELLEVFGMAEEADQLAEELRGELLEYQECKLMAQKLADSAKGFDYLDRKPQEFPLDMTYTRLHEPYEIFKAYISAVGKGKRRLPPPVEAFSKIVAHKIVSVSSRISFLLDRLKSGKKSRFLSLFEKSESRSEMVATFLAVLSLAKAKKIEIEGSGEDAFIELK